jgi:CheY-like chemotaxis protein
MSKILVVEDEPMVAELITLEIEDRNHEAHLAVNGKEAIELAKSMQPDAIVMDRTMPVMDGVEATRRLRQDPATRGIPIVILTAAVMPQDREHAIASGCDDLEEKPVDFDRLFQKLDDLIRRRRI